jgi:uncharacterized lipoprotein YmbA
MVWLTIAGLTGCASSPAARLLSLPLPTQATPGEADAALPHEATMPPCGQPATSRVLSVRRINIPEYLQTSKVRFRQADSVMGEWPNTAWAERLEVGLSDHLIMRLRLALPGWTVCDRSCPSAASAASASILTLDLAPLDYVRAQNQLRAEARWQLDAPSDKGHPGRHMTRSSRAIAIPVQPDSAPGHAAALGKVLDELTQDIAPVVRLCVHSSDQ